jgi:hypothetical protein
VQRVKTDYTRAAIALTGFIGALRAPPYLPAIDVESSINLGRLVTPSSTAATR